MKTYDRIPRNLLRVKLRELQPGEGTWIDHHYTHITENGRVFVDLDSPVYRYTDDWEREAQKGRFFVQRMDDNSWRIHLLERDHISPRGYDLSKEDADHYAAVREIVVHPPEDDVCPTCKGMAIANPRGSERPVLNVPWETLRRIEEILGQADRLRPHTKDLVEAIKAAEINREDRGKSTISAGHWDAIMEAFARVTKAKA